MMIIIFILNVEIVDSLIEYIDRWQGILQW